MGTPPPPPFLDPPQDVDDALGRHFSGKRASERRPTQRNVLLQGSQGRIPGRLHDLSEGGALVEVLGDGFHEVAAAGDLPEALRLAEAHFGGGVRLWLDSSEEGALPIALDAEVVRVTVGPDPRDGVRLGCHFLAAPGAEDRRRLGFPPATPAQPSWVPRSTPPPYALLFPTTGRVAGPLCAAKLLEIEGPRLTLRVEGTHVEGGLSSRIGAPLVRLSLWHRGGAIWETEARVVVVRRDPAAPGALAIEVDAASAPGRPVLRHFRRAG